MSARQQFAQTIANFINCENLNNPFGGDVYKDGNKYTVCFSSPAILDGEITIYGEKFVQIKSYGRAAFPYHGASVVLRNKDKVIPFLKAAFTDRETEKARKILDEQPKKD
ncbi:MAG TPA: hypothetical protein VMW91_11340 [Desulfosporosinus sp.]|nr:hypothetical protein [Desulfosporosinus sp.]